MQLNRNLVVVDTETTGLDPRTERIVELSLLIVKPDGTTTPFSALIDPGRPIPPAATAVNQITDAMVKDARTFSSFAEQLARGLTNVDIAGKNVKFDLGFLSAEFTRCDVAWEHTGATIDLEQLWRVLEPRTLSDAVQHFLGRSHVGAHRAEADVAVTWEVIQEQVRRLAVRTPEAVTSVSALYEFLHPTPPNAVDRAGKILWANGVACLGPWSKKHANQPLVTVPKSYLRWIADDAGFAFDTRRIARQAADGIYPTKVVAA